MKAEALVDAKADMLADVEAMTLRNTLVEGKTERLVDGSADYVAEIAVEN